MHSKHSGTHCGIQHTILEWNFFYFCFYGIRFVCLLFCCFFISRSILKRIGNFVNVKTFFQLIFSFLDLAPPLISIFQYLLCIFYLPTNFLFNWSLDTGFRFRLPAAYFKCMIKKKKKQISNKFTEKQSKKSKWQAKLIETNQVWIISIEFNLFFPVFQHWQWQILIWFYFIIEFTSKCMR